MVSKLRIIWKQTVTADETAAGGLSPSSVLSGRSAALRKDERGLAEWALDGALATLSGYNVQLPWDAVLKDELPSGVEAAQSELRARLAAAESMVGEGQPGVQARRLRLREYALLQGWADYLRHLLNPTAATTDGQQRYWRSPAVSAGATAQ